MGPGQLHSALFSFAHTVSVQKKNSQNICEIVEYKGKDVCVEDKEAQTKFLKILGKYFTPWKHFIPYLRQFFKKWEYNSLAIKMDSFDREKILNAAKIAGGGNALVLENVFR